MLDNLDSPAPARLTRALARWARVLLWLLAGAWLLFALSWGALHGLIVPRVEVWRPALERLATQELGTTVSIGSISAESSGPVPSLQLADVVLYDASGREALRLPRVQASLSMRSLWRLGFDQLVLESLVLDVRRTADGRLLLAGLELDTSALGETSSLGDWLLDQPELAIRGATLRWTDDMRAQTAPLELKAIDFVLRNPGRRQHQFRIDATPPAGWGAPLSIQGQFRRPAWQIRAGTWREWSGTLYASLPAVDAGSLGAYVDLQAVLGLQLQAGKGGARAWVEVERGQVSQVTSDLALSEVALQWQGAAGLFTLQNFHTRLLVQQHERSTSIATQGLAFVTADGRPWPGGDLRYAQTLDTEGRLATLDVAGDELDALALRQLAQHLPLPAGVTEWLDQTQASGRAETFRLAWSAPQGGQAAEWNASGKLRQLSLRAAAVPPPMTLPDGTTYYPAARPGVTGADIDFSLNRQGGQATFSLHKGSLVLPGVFEEALLPLDRLQAEVNWSIAGDAIQVEVPKLLLSNPDLEAQAALKWRTADPATSSAGSRFPGVLELDAQIHRATASRVFRYLPRAVDAYTRNYLQHAVLAGQARDARLRIAGDLWDFPFAEPATGTLDVSAKLHQVALNYVPQHLLDPQSPSWPSLQVQQARLTIDRTRLVIDQAQAEVRDWPALRIVGARAEIPNFYSYTPELKVHGLIRGPAQDALAFIQSSPVNGMTDGVLGQARGTGAAELDLGLHIPLVDTEASSVKGQLRLAGTNMRITPDTPWLQAIHGTLDFTESQFNLPAARAIVLDGPIRFSGYMTDEPDSPIVFQGRGQVSAQGLAQADHWPWLAPVRQVAAGQTAYQARLEFSALGTSLQVDSSLQGMALHLPAPFYKTAATSLPMRLLLQPLASGASGHERQEVVFVLGTGPDPLLSLQYHIEHTPQATRVLAGSLGIGSARAALPARGVRAQMQIDKLALQDWQRAAARVQASATAAPSGHGASMQYWPNDFDVAIRRLEQGSRVFNNVVATGTRNPERWQLTVDATELAGLIEYRPDATRLPGQLYARLARLDLSPGAATDVENLLLEQPRAMPAIDLVVERLHMGQHDLGRLEMQAANSKGSIGAQGSGREWRLNTLHLTLPEARLRATGNWSAGAAVAGRSSNLQLHLDIQDAGLLLERLGMPGVVRGGKGTIAGQMAWGGSPLSLHLPSLGGALTIDVGSGQFLQADPGIARLIGVLNLQALPRRLALDFRDVFSEGFAFDFVRGHVAIGNGVARTNNLQMKGVSAAVLIEGQADILRQTQDIKAVVIPELNTGTASLVATVINPVTGLGSFLAQFLLRQPLQAAATRQFHVTGPWADPQVAPVARYKIVSSETQEPSTSTGTQTP